MNDPTPTPRCELSDADVDELTGGVIPDPWDDDEQPDWPNNPDPDFGPENLSEGN